MNRTGCLGLSVLELSKMLIYEIWCDEVIPNYGEKAKLFYIYCMYMHTLYR